MIKYIDETSLSFIKLTISLTIERAKVIVMDTLLIFLEVSGKSTNFAGNLEETSQRVKLYELIDTFSIQPRRSCSAGATVSTVAASGSVLSFRSLRLIFFTPPRRRERFQAARRRRTDTRGYISDYQTDCGKTNHHTDHILQVGIYSNRNFQEGATVAFRRQRFR